MDDLTKIIRELKARLLARYGDRLVKLILFGSYARGDATEDSDIDVLAVVKGVHRAGEELFIASEDAAEVSLNHDTLVGLVLVSEEDFHSRNTPLLISVRREGIEV